MGLSSPRCRGDSAKVSERRNHDSEIVGAAIAVFSQKGYSAASLQDVADRACPNFCVNGV